MILFLDQALFTAGGEQVVEALLGFVELCLLDVEHGRDFAVAIQSFAVGAAEPHQAHHRHQAQAHLQGEADAAAEQFLRRR